MFCPYLLKYLPLNSFILFETVKYFVFCETKVILHFIFFICNCRKTHGQTWKVELRAIEKESEMTDFMTNIFMKKLNIYKDG